MSTRQLLFEWPARHTLQVILPAMIVLAAFAHAAVFLLFSIVYPAPQNSSLAPVQVFIPAPGSVEAEQLARILRSSDPAEFAPGRNVSLPETKLSPDADATTASLLPMPQVAASDTTGGQPWFHRRIVTAEAPPKSAVSAGAPTRLACSPELAARLPRERMAFDLEAPAGWSPEPAKFLIRVSPEGRVVNIFMQSGSGSPVLDNAATQALLAVQFSPAPEETWGVVRFQWGDDLRPTAEQ